MVGAAQSALSRLLERETAAVSRLAFAPPAHGLSDRQKYRELQQVSKTCLTWGLDLPSGFTNWSAGISAIPLIETLLIQPHQIFDIIPQSEADFVKRTGVTISQFKELVARGYVLPNLAYDSEILSPGGVARDPAASAYAKFDYLAELIDPDHGLMTINGVRRAAIFDWMGYSRSGCGMIVEKSLEQLERLASGYTHAQLKKYNLGMMTRNTSDISHVVANNMMYLDVFGRHFNAGFDQGIIKTFFEDPGAKDLSWIISQIRGRKTYLCGPVTACFGGIQSLVEMDYHRAVSLGPPVRPEWPDNVSADLKAFNKYQIFLSEASRRQHILGLSREITYPLSDGSFASYLDFLDDFQRDRTVAEDLFQACKDYEPGESFTKLEDYYRVYEDVAKAAEASPGLKGLLATVMASGTTAALGAAVGFLPKTSAEGATGEGISRRRFLTTITGAAVGAAVGAGFEEISEGIFLEKIEDFTGKYENDVAIDASRRIVASTHQLAKIKISEDWVQALGMP